MWIELVLIVSTLFIVWQCLKRPTDYPPGLWGLPVLGYIPFWSNNENILFDLQKKFGDVVSWRFGNRVVVLMYDFKTIKETFNGADFVDRPNMDFFSLICGNEKNDKGLVGSNGTHWHSIRRFALRHLRDLGMGKSHFSSAVLNEASEFVNDLKQQAGKPAPIPTSLTVSVLNVIWQITAGKRYAFDDERILEFDHLIDDLQKSFGAVVLLEFFPFIKYMLPQSILNKMFGLNVRGDLSEKVSKFIKIYIDEHVESLDRNNSRDFIDDYLIEMEKQKDNPSSTMSINDLEFCISDLFGAGTETTTNSLTWAIFYLASYPDIQKKLQTEVDNVLPDGVSVMIEDKIKLPYLDAFIHETLRHASFAVIGGMHAASQNTKINGYFVPKDAIILGVSGYSHFNPAFYESPEDFQPERFLNDDGKLEVPKEGFLPFGIGRRVCIGESLARMEIFIFLTTMLQNLNFAPPSGKTIDMRPMKENPFTRLPRADQHVLVTLRT